MTIQEMVYIRNELNHAKEVLHWLKNKGFVYGSRELYESLVGKWEILVEFWTNELKSF